jgi:GTP cyclohydrolase II
MRTSDSLDQEHTGACRFCRRFQAANAFCAIHHARLSRFSQRCDCGSQLEAALQAIAREGRGVLLYLRQEGRGIGLLNKIRAYELQDGGADTVEANERLGFAADQRDYAMCLPMLEHLGVKSLRLMTNNPRKVKALTDMGIVVAERVPLHTGHNPHNRLYLATKASKLDHMMGNEHQGEVDRA